jgi:hypothetical protein
MKKTILISALMFTTLAISFSQSGENGNKAHEEEPTVIMTNIMLATELAGYGYANKSAIALIEAARIIEANPTRSLSPARSETSTGSEGDKSGSAIELNPEKLLTDAEQYSAGNKSVQNIIKDTRETFAQNKAVASKGRVAGPAIVTRKVYADSRSVDYIYFEGNELAEVAVIGDGDTDLDLYIYDENGNLIDEDEDYTDDCYASFVPRWRGTFKVVILNRGSVYNNCVLMTN